jgi:type II secretory pathway pseudopilin PulG
MANQKPRDGGYSLIEMLTAMAIAMVVLGLVTGSLISMMKSNASADTKLANLDQVRQAADAMSKDIRTAIKPELMNNACATNCTVAFVSATSASAQFFANEGDTDSTGKISTPTLVTYSAAADPTDKTGLTARITETRQSVSSTWTSGSDYTWGPASTRVVASGIEWPYPASSSSLFVYHDPTGVKIATSPSMTTSQLGQIASVDISLPLGTATAPTAGVSTSVYLPNSILGN